MSNYGLISALREAASEDTNDDLYTLLSEAADALEAADKSLSRVNYLYKETSRDCERYYTELDGIVKFLQAPYNTGVAPTVNNVGSEVRCRLEGVFLGTSRQV